MDDPKKYIQDQLDFLFEVQTLLLNIPLKSKAQEEARDELVDSYLEEELEHLLSIKRRQK